MLTQRTPLLSKEMGLMFSALSSGLFFWGVGSGVRGSFNQKHWSLSHSSVLSASVSSLSYKICPLREQ